MSSAPPAMTCSRLYMSSSSVVFGLPAAAGCAAGRCPGGILLDGGTPSHPSDLGRLGGRLLPFLPDRRNNQDQQQDHGGDQEGGADGAREEHRGIAARYQQR